MPRMSIQASKQAHDVMLISTEYGRGRGRGCSAFVLMQMLFNDDDHHHHSSYEKQKHSQVHRTLVRHNNHKNKQCQRHDVWDADDQNAWSSRRPSTGPGGIGKRCHGFQRRGRGICIPCTRDTARGMRRMRIGMEVDEKRALDGSASGTG